MKNLAARASRNVLTKVSSTNHKGYFKRVERKS